MSRVATCMYCNKRDVVESGIVTLYTEDFGQAWFCCTLHCALFKHNLSEKHPRHSPLCGNGECEIDTENGRVKSTYVHKLYTSIMSRER